MKRIVVGIEGGGTSTRMLLKTDDEEPSYIERKGSLKFTGGTFDASAAKLVELLRAFPDFEPMFVRSLGIGLSGASQPAEQELYRAAIRKAFGNPTLPVHIEGDATLAFRCAASDDEPGMLLIAGTGTALLVRDNHDALHLLGGWGTVLGDEGSGFWIGVEALKHVTRVLDKMIPSDKLFDAVMERLPEDIRERPRLLSRRIDSKSLIPSEIAPLVFLMGPSDKTARKIIQSASEHLVRFVRAGLAEFDEATYAELFVTGSIAKQPEMRELLQQGLHDLPIVVREIPDRAPSELALSRAQALIAETLIEE